VRREWRTLDGKTWSLIEYRLTVSEWIQLRIATIRAYLTGKAIADFLSIELENLLCGYVPSRHRVVKPYVGDVAE